MPHIQVKTVKKIHTFLKRSNKRINLLFGGAGSGKSWSIATFLVFLVFYTQLDIRILVTRKTLPALKTSAFQLILDILNRYELPYKLNKTEMIISNGPNEILFRSLDDIEKLKSIERINYVWAEEATELTRNDYIQLDLRCRGANKNGHNRLFFSFNPISTRSFLKPLTEHPPDDTDVSLSTFEDNPFLPAREKRVIAGLEKKDEVYYKIYGKGQWASHKAQIYSNWKVVKPSEWPDEYDDVFYGLDFGFNNPSALLEVTKRGVEVWERQVIYRTQLTNTQLIALMKDRIAEEDRHRYIFADSAEPDRIEEICLAGFNCIPVKKGPNSVKDGINNVKDLTVYIDYNSPDLKTEKESYKWKQDKNGDTLDVPVDWLNHLMDAERYAISGHMVGAPQLYVIDTDQEETPPERYKEIPLDGNVDVAAAKVDRHRNQALSGSVGWRE